MKMDKKKKLLILIDWFAPGYKAGGPIRSCLNLSYALKDIYEIYIITTDRDIDETKPYPNIQSDRWGKFIDRVNVYYFSPQRLTYKNLQALLLEVDADTIYLNSMFSPFFTIFPLSMVIRGMIKARVVLAPRGMLHKGAMQYGKLKKQGFLALLKFLNVGKKLIFQATDAQEAQDIQHYFGEKTEVNLTVNLPSMKQYPWESIPKKEGELRLIFISRIHPKKNLAFLLKLLPDIHANIYLDIIGPNEPSSAYWKNCQNLIAKLPSHIKVNYLGAFPHHIVQTKIKDYHFFVLPTYGENFGHAIFESMAAGKPVIISNKTPWRNLEKLKAGWDLPLDQKAFVHCLNIAAQMDQVKYDEWSRKTWEYAQNYLEQPALIENYKHLFG